MADFHLAALVSGLTWLNAILVLNRALMLLVTPVL